MDTAKLKNIPVGQGEEDGSGGGELEGGAGAGETEEQDAALQEGVQGEQHPDGQGNTRQQLDSYFNR